MKETKHITICWWPLLGLFGLGGRDDHLAGRALRGVEQVEVVDGLGWFGGGSVPRWREARGDWSGSGITEDRGRRGGFRDQGRTVRRTAAAEAGIGRRERRGGFRAFGNNIKLSGHGRKLYSWEIRHTTTLYSFPGTLRQSTMMGSLLLDTKCKEKNVSPLFYSHKFRSQRSISEGISCKLYQ